VELECDNRRLLTSEECPFDRTSLALKASSPFRAKSPHSPLLAFRGTGSGYGIIAGMSTNDAAATALAIRLEIISLCVLLGGRICKLGWYSVNQLWARSHHRTSHSITVELSDSGGYQVVE